MAHDVFICYSSQDKAVADAVCATLESRKIRCWIAPRDVLPSIPFAEALIDGINNSRLMVLVFSKNSNQSPQVMREAERAVNKGIPILPFRIEDVALSKSMEYFLSAPHWLDALTPPMEKHLQKLADTVATILGTEVPITTEAPLQGKVKNKGAAKKGNNRPIYIIASIAVVVVIILVIFLLRGGSDKGQDGLSASNITSTKSAATNTSATSIKPSTTTGTAKLTTTPPETTPPTTTPLKPTVVQQPQRTLNSGTSIKGEFTFSGEIQWYTFTIEAPDVVHIVLCKSTASPIVPFMGLLSPDGVVMYEDYNRGLGGYVTGDPVSIDFALTKTGKYTVRIKDYRSGTGFYTLSFTLLSKTDNPLSSGSSIQRQFSFGGEIHWYTFEGKAGDSVNIVFSKGKDSPIVPFMGFLSPDGPVIFEDYNRGLSGYVTELPVNIDHTLTKTGKYIIRVRDLRLGTGPYTLSFFLAAKT
jgi:hypothetical protein